MKTLMVSREAGLQNRQWYVVDATNVVLGRLATRVATILRGKHKATFTPHEDTGDFVVIINAEQVRLTGNKMQNKVYRRHTGYPGGVRARTAAEQMVKDPTKILRDAVEGMLPKNRLGRQLATKLKIYKDGRHPHSAQQPIELRLAEATTGAHS